MKKRDIKILGIALGVILSVAATVAVVQWGSVPNGLTYYFPGKTPGGLDTVYSFHFNDSRYNPMNGANVDRYGAKGDGVTDDLAAFNAAIATGRAVFGTGGKRYKLSASPNQLANGQLFNGQYCTIIINNFKGFIMGDNSLVVNTRFVGSTKTTFKANEVGIYAFKKIGIGVIGCTFDSLAGPAIRIDSSVNRLGTGNVNYEMNLIAHNRIRYCSSGINTGKRGEYIESNTNNVVACDTGYVMGGGNNKIIGGVYDFSNFNLYLKNSGANDSHSSATGASFNHAITDNVKADSITYCYKFISCQILASQVHLNNSKLIWIDGCLFSPRTASLGITNNNSDFIVTNSIFMSSTPYTETGAKPTHYFSNNVLAYNNVVVTPTQRAIDSALFCATPILADASKSISASANYTAPNGPELSVLPTLTANRTYSLPGAVYNSGIRKYIDNRNGSGTFGWTFGTTVYLPDGVTTVTVIPNGTMTIVESDGSKWVVAGSYSGANVVNTVYSANSYISITGGGSSSVGVSLVTTNIPTGAQTGLAQGDYWRFNGSNWFNSPQTRIVSTVTSSTTVPALGNESNYTYMANSSSQLTLTIPFNSVAGAKITLNALGTGGAKILLNTGDKIVSKAASTTVTTGSVAIVQNESITIECETTGTAGNTWIVRSVQGSPTYL